jgi:hypothetical protein
MSEVPPSLALSGLSAAIDAMYAQVLARDDIEADNPSPHIRTPAKGMLLHEQVVMFAHMQFVCRMLNKAKRLVCFMDQDSGLRGAFMAAMGERVKKGTAEGFYVNHTDLPIDAKHAAIAKSKKLLNEVMAENPGMSEYQAAMELGRQRLKYVTKHGAWDDYWFTHPLADPREPEKQICWLTNRKPIPDNPEARAAELEEVLDLYMKATLTAVDRFFMQVRRAITVAERGIASASADKRIWFGKNAYNPRNLVMLLEVFRVYFNYCEVGHDKKTPAMRLGLARGPVSPEDILYFRPREQVGETREEESPALQTQSGASNQSELRS